MNIGKLLKSSLYALALPTVHNTNNSGVRVATDVFISCLFD